MTVALAGSAARTADAGISSGTRNVFVPVTPCRLFDTRPGSDNVGPKSTPMGPGETFTVQATGTQGKCNLPAGVTAVSMNVTTIGGTAASFLTVFPAGTSKPLSANLNWVAGQAPTPNLVVVGLSSDGKVGLFNAQGTVNVVADVSGYYTDHDFDDRYYTKTQVDASLAGKAPKDPARLVVGPSEFIPDPAYLPTYTIVRTNDEVYFNSLGCAFAPLHLPNGTRITRLAADVITRANTAVVNVFRYATGVRSPNEPVAGLAIPAGTVGQAVKDETQFSIAPIDNTNYWYQVSFCAQTATNSQTEFFDLVIDTV
jgi:hypothetical protein